MRMSPCAVVAAGVALWLSSTSLAVHVHATSSGLQQGEDLPGGAATSIEITDSQQAFSQASANLPSSRHLDFRIGGVMFRKVWRQPSGELSRSDGLGPLYNARSCGSCHRRDGRGRPPDNSHTGDAAVSMLLKLSVRPRSRAERDRLAARRAAFIPEPVYGGQLQDIAIKGHRAEGRASVVYEQENVILAGGESVTLRKPAYSVRALGYGPFQPGVMLSPRIAPQMIGLGLIEAIPAAAIMQLSDPDDADKDGISGRANRVWSRRLKAVTLGRFGWKAAAPSVLQQSAEAFAFDIGISSWLVPAPSGDCTEAQLHCRAAASGGDEGGEEINRDLLAAVAHYARNLAVPRRRGAADAQILKGKGLFADLGCARCHNPSFKTGERPREPHLSRQLIWPYSDLLLHDMGEGLADHRPEASASGREWRTAPLWGIGLTEAVSGHRSFLHDGRARTIVEAILWHGGEARAARDGFAALPRAKREILIAFVNSL